MPLIVDSSALMRSIQTLPDAEAFQTAMTNEVCYAPTLVLSELANAIWKTIRFGNLNLRVGKQLLNTMVSIPVLQEDADFIEAALDIAIANEHPVYDCLFIAMSRQMNAPVLTADRKMQRKFPNDAFIRIEY